MPAKKKSTRVAAKKATRTPSKKKAARKSSPKKKAPAKAAKAEAEEEPAPKPKAAKPAGGKGKLQAHPDSGLTQPQLKKLWARLQDERDKLSVAIRGRVNVATADATPLAEDGDIAQRATEQDYQLRLADKQRKLLNQILAAMDKFEEGEYGICEGTEEPIGFRRLEIRPWARYSVEYKELRDRQNR